MTWDDDSDDSSTHSESDNLKALTSKTSTSKISSTPSLVEINDAHSSSSQEEDE